MRWPRETRTAKPEIPGLLTPLPRPRHKMSQQEVRHAHRHDAMRQENYNPCQREQLESRSTIYPLSIGLRWLMTPQANFAEILKKYRCSICMTLIQILPCQ